ncbi:carbohydrate kinase [Ruminococcaceae bacterium OttesenSCG-928-I18]|nr:carbohydrate kinase [Ruminococcaceae bacterium OttesenSCG-928-I18]
MDVFSLGEMVIDFLPGDGDGVYIRNAGGAPANMAIAAARNELDVGFCGKVGDDDFGLFLQQTLRENKVRILCPERSKEAITTMAFVTLQPDGERSFTFCRKPGADMLLTKAEVKKEDVQNTAVLHAGSCSLSKGPEVEATEYALALADEMGKLVSFDVNYRNLMWDDDIEAARAAVLKILPHVDLLKISQEEAPMLGGEENLPSVMAQYGISVLVMTLGSKGARCYFDGSSFTAGVPDVKRVDTTGAGDAFWGTFIATLLRGGVRKTGELTESALRKAVDYGNVAGTLCVQKKGALNSLPTLAEIEAFLSGS